MSRLVKRLCGLLTVGRDFVNSTSNAIKWQRRQRHLCLRDKKSPRRLDDTRSRKVLLRATPSFSTRKTPNSVVAPLPRRNRRSRCWPRVRVRNCDSTAHGGNFSSMRSADFRLTFTFSPSSRNEGIGSSVEQSQLTGVTISGSQLPQISMLVQTFQNIVNYNILHASRLRLTSSISNSPQPSYSTHKSFPPPQHPQLNH